MPIGRGCAVSFKVFPCISKWKKKTQQNAHTFQKLPNQLKFQSVASFFVKQTNLHETYAWVIVMLKLRCFDSIAVWLFFFSAMIAFAMQDLLPIDLVLSFPLFLFSSFSVCVFSFHNMLCILCLCLCQMNAIFTVMVISVHIICIHKWCRWWWYSRHAYAYNPCAS